MKIVLAPSGWRLFLAVFAAACVFPLMTLAEGLTSAIRAETLLQTTSSWNGATYNGYSSGTPEITVRRITIPAHGVLAWHKHPMPSAACVLSGEITIEEPGGAKRHFAAGEVIPETVNTAHRGIVGDQPAVFLVFYAGVKGMPLSQEIP